MSREDVEELTEGDSALLVLSSFCFLRVSSSIFLFEFEIYLIETLVFFNTILILARIKIDEYIYTLS